MKPKDKKAKESTIGKIIYGFLLFMPLMAIFVKCGYTMFNKNAKDSYYGETINNKQIVQIDDISTYTGFIIYDVDSYITYSFTDGTNFFNVEDFNSEITGLNNEDVAKIQMYSSIYQTDYNMWLSLRDYQDNILKNINLVNTNIYFTCYIVDYSKETNNTTLGNFENYFFKEEYNQFSYIDNVFYYSVNQVNENPLFNWTQNTFIYTGVQTFTNALNINNVFFPLLLSYWMILSVVYIIYDLGLMMIQIVHRKIHELGDSI